MWLLLVAGKLVWPVAHAHGHVAPIVMKAIVAEAPPAVRYAVDVSAFMDHPPRFLVEKILTTEFPSSASRPQERNRSRGYTGSPVPPQQSRTRLTRKEEIEQKRREREQRKSARQEALADQEARFKVRREEWARERIRVREAREEQHRREERDRRRRELQDPEVDKAAHQAMAKVFPKVFGKDSPQARRVRWVA